MSASRSKDPEKPVSWESLQEQINQLEEQVKIQQLEITQLKKDMKFYEMMLLEEYHLLLRLLGEDQPKARIHQL